MDLITTLPSQTECEERGYIQGKSGHAYTKVSGRHGEAIFEVRKDWYGCGTCKRYVLLDDQVTEIIDGIAEREDEYAKADQVIRAFVERRIQMKNKANQRGT